MKRKLKTKLTARKLKAVREKFGKTQKEFAKIMKCSPSAIAMKETGERGITEFDDAMVDLYLSYQKLKKQQ